MEYIKEGSDYEFGRSAGDGSLSDLQNFAVKMPAELPIRTKYVDMKHFEKDSAFVYATFSEFLAINSYATTDAATNGLFQLDADPKNGFFGFPNNNSGADINEIAAGFSPFGSFAQKLAIGKEGLSSVPVVQACRFYFQKTGDGKITLYMPHTTPNKVGVSTFDSNGDYSSGEYKDKADVPEKIQEFSGDGPAVFGAVKDLEDNCYSIDVPVIDATGRTLTEVDASIKLQTVVSSDAPPPSDVSSETTGKSATEGVESQPSSGKKAISFSVIGSESKQWYAGPAFLDVDEQIISDLGTITFVYKVRGSDATEKFKANKAFFEEKGYKEEFNTAFSDWTSQSGP